MIDCLRAVAVSTLRRSYCGGISAWAEYEGAVVQASLQSMLVRGEGVSRDDT